MEMHTPDAVNVRDGVAARLERLPLTRYQKLVFAVIATAWLFDSMDLGIMTFVLGSIKTEFGLSATQAGLLASSSFLGMLIGAAIAGMLADRYGRNAPEQTIERRIAGLLDKNMVEASCQFSLAFGGGV